MPQPTPYNRQNSFTLLTQENPAQPYTGSQLDSEFNAVKVTLDELLARLGIIQRDDGRLANGSVGPDQVSSAFVVGVDPPTAWTPDTEYAVTDSVFVGSILYRASEPHTSSADFETDLAAGKWVLVADFIGEFDPQVIEDGSITTAKLANEAVATEKIVPAAVTGTRIADNAVGAAKIAEGAVTDAKIANAAVVAAKLATNAVTSDKLQDEAVTFAKIQAIATAKVLGRSSANSGPVEQLDATAAGLALLAAASAAAQRTAIDAEQKGVYAGVDTKTENYTLALTDVGKLLLMDSSSARQFTLPANATVAWPVNAGADFSRLGTGAVTVKGATGVTVNGVSAGTVTIPARYGGVTAVKIATNTWLIPNATAS